MRRLNAGTIWGEVTPSGPPGPPGPQGEPGKTPQFTRIVTNTVGSDQPANVRIQGPVEDLEITFDIPQGIQGIQGIQGKTGNGIQKIEKTGKDGATDFYTIYFTDGTSFEYSVVNGMTDDGEITMDHSKLINLDYEHSGHTGFASSKELAAHLSGKNPHNITCEMIGAAPAKLEELPETDISKPQAQVRTNILAEQNGTSTRISLNSLKEMNTKIVSLDNEGDIGKQDLSKDDFVYIKN